MVLETDGPYLAPVPHRGKRNEPAYLRLIADRVAAIYQISTEELAKITTSNSLRIFTR
ncbi:MAG: TatD family hydrolase [Flavobacteriaceae bacterium]